MRSKNSKYIEIIEVIVSLFGLINVGGFNFWKDYD